MELRHSLVAVAVVERFLFFGLSGATKERDRCREMAVVERWPSVSRSNTLNRLACARDGTKLLPGLDYVCNTG